MFSWVSLLSFTCIMAYTPGPINIMSMNNAKTIGVKGGILFNLGNYLGHFLLMLACLAFSKTLHDLLPQIQLPMKLLGAAYLAYLMMRTLFPAKKQESGGNHNRSFVVGVLLQLINVKDILFGLTAMSLYLLPYHTSIPILILFALLMSSIQFTGSVCWTLLGALMSKAFNRYGKLLNVIIAALLLFCIVKLFL